MRGWGQLDAVHIARTAAEFVIEAEAALLMAERDPQWLEAVDRELEYLSWDRTWARMVGLTAAAIEARERASGARNPGPPPLVEKLASQLRKENARV